MNSHGSLSCRRRFSTLALRGLPAPRVSAYALLVALGVLAFAEAHRLAYLLGGAPAAAHAGHGYLRVLELSAGAVTVLALALFSAGVWRSAAPGEALLPLRRPLPLLGICGIAPAAIFALVEFCERSFEMPHGLPLLIGVALQVLFGCAALLGWSGLLHIVVALKSATRASFLSRRITAGRRRLDRWARPHGTLIGLANPSRAPPAA